MSEGDLARSCLRNSGATMKYPVDESRGAYTCARSRTASASGQPLTDPRLRQDGYHRPVDEDLPLGQYPQFRGLTGREFRWGPSEAWRAWFAGGGVDGLVGDCCVG